MKIPQKHTNVTNPVTNRTKNMKMWIKKYVIA